MNKFFIDFFLTVVIFMLLIVTFAVIGFPMLIFIIGNANIKAIMLAVLFLLSAIITHYKNQYEREERNNE
jgi:hypothetical protein